MLIAHRGYYDEYIPENSIEAFKKCLVRKIPIELDVHLTKDNKVVVFHDTNTFRMTGINKIIEEESYEDLKKLKLKKTKEKIPLLEEVLKIINDKVFLLIELKNKKVGPLEQEILKLLKPYKNLSIQTFNLKSVNYLKKYSNYNIGLLILGTKSYIKKDIKRIDFLSCPFNKIKNIKVKKEVYAWNINSKEDLNYARKYTNNFIVNIKKINEK